jgi:hypothetical protein
MLATPENLRNHEIIQRMQEKILNNLEAAERGEGHLAEEKKQQPLKKKRSI